MNFPPHQCLRNHDARVVIGRCSKEVVSVLTLRHVFSTSGSLGHSNWLSAGTTRRCREEEHERPNENTTRCGDVTDTGCGATSARGRITGPTKVSHSHVTWVVWRSTQGAVALVRFSTRKKIKRCLDARATKRTVACRCRQERRTDE